MRPAILFLLAASASAQTLSSRRGWSFEDTLQTAGDVLVGDIVSGSALDEGSLVSVPKVRELWFLRRADGKIEPLQASAMISTLGGVYLPAAEAYGYFSSHPDPRLKLAGIQSRLEMGDASSLLDPEKNLAAIAPRRREREPAGGARSGPSGSR